MTGPSRPQRSRRRWWIRHSPVVVVVLALVAGSMLVGLVAVRDSEAATGWSVTATPDANLVDGQRVTVNFRSDANVNVVNVEIRQCRSDASFTTLDDFFTRTGKCPAGPVSSSADTSVARNAVQGIIDRIHAPDGMNLLFRVGVGTVTWKETTGEYALTCDPSNPCSLVAQLQFGDGTVAYEKVPLTFSNDDPVAACGGAAGGVLSSGASDQLIDAWAGWTRDFCAEGIATGAPSRSTFGGEGLAVRDFGKGNIDFAYTSAGYNADVGLAPSDIPRRAAVATPLALNAAVIAVGGGYRPPPGEKVAYPEIKLTAGEAAAIFAGGLNWVGSFNQPYRAAILSGNPVLGGELNFGGSGIDFRPAVSSAIESVTWYVSHFFAERSPADWILPGETPTPRPPSNSFAVAEPAFPELNTFSGRPSLRKVTDPVFFANETGPLWVLTDLATAHALGLTPVSIQIAGGAYVAPTEQSMQAAVASMTLDENGMLQPDPNAGAGAAATAGATPYPLTFVEYAMTPKEPLVDTETCTLRSNSQTLLSNWMTYLVGDGQDTLPAGMLALPADLKTQAQESLSTIGTAEVTGVCAGRVVTPNGAPVGGVSAPAAAAGALPSSPGARPGGLASTGLAAGALGTTPAAAASAQDAKEVLAAVPAFAGHSLPDSTGGIVALLGIVLVTSLAAWLTAGGSIGGANAATIGGGGMVISGPTRGARPRTSGLVLLWLGVAATGVGLVVYQLGPLLQQRDQHDLFTEYRSEVKQAAKSSSGLPGATAEAKAPEIGAPVGVLEIGGLHQQAVVVEGVGPSETQAGPGHVPGTAGLGQPGNSAVVARRNGYGGSFADLESLKQGAPILVTTTQGQSVYKVRSVKRVDIVGGEESTGGASTSHQEPSSAQKDSAAMTEDQLYGPSEGDRLTLVTSGSRQFWNTSSAVVVTAKMVGKPFEFTPQGGRSNGQTGRAGDSGAWAAVILVLALYAAAIVGAVLLYRRMQFRIAYILTVAPLVALTVIAGETLSRLLPAWL